MVEVSIWKLTLNIGGENSGNFVTGRGNLERCEVREYENKFLWQFSENILILL